MKWSAKLNGTLCSANIRVINVSAFITALSVSFDYKDRLGPKPHGVKTSRGRNSFGAEMSGYPDLLLMSMKI